ncbi:hypothetical protein [Cohnella sp. 56]|uniref:hypothetical protein n=1 Tax=Cohnella sp. 56 TaxID=3113722 RepID=UPI0030EAB258
MMTVKYRIECFECDIVVRQKDEAHTLSIQSRKTPLGNGNRLAQYPSEQEAVRAADQLCQTYTILREFGYHLSGGDFVRDGVPSISVVSLLDQALDASDLRSLLNREAIAHGVQETG